MLEFEKKLLLTPLEYHILRQKFRAAKIVSQINYYYDTPLLELNRAGTTCRIREKDGAYVATVKKHCAGSEDCSIELQSEVDNAQDTSLFPKGVVLQGSLRTDRLSITGYPGVKLDLDKNTYLGITDYELELEYNLEFKPVCAWILNQLSEFLGYHLFTSAHQEFLLRTGRAKPKSQRFFYMKFASPQRQA